MKRPLPPEALPVLFSACLSFLGKRSSARSGKDFFPGKGVFLFFRRTFPVQGKKVFRGSFSSGKEVFPFFQEAAPGASAARFPTRTGARTGGKRDLPGAAEGSGSGKAPEGIFDHSRKLDLNYIFQKTCTFLIPFLTTFSS